jgi:hypothetical protein
MRNALIGCFVFSLGAGTGFQHIATLDAPIGHDIRIDKSLLARRCAIGTLAHQIALQARVPFGVEHTLDCWLVGWGNAPSAESDVLTGMTARQAFDYLHQHLPGYRWQEMEGVVVIRPTTAWNDARNVLNLHRPVQRHECALGRYSPPVAPVDETVCVPPA